MFLKLYVIVTLLFVSTNGNELRDINDQLQVQLHEPIGERQLGIEFLSQYCQQNRLNDLQAAGKQLHLCVKAIVDIDKITEDFVLIRNIEKAGRNTTGTFKKYCDLIPQYQNCYSKFFPTMLSCLPTRNNSNEDLEYVRRTFIAFTNAFCANNGDDLSYFRTQGGLECIVRQHNKIGHCMKTFLGPTLEVLRNYYEELPDILFKADECTTMTDLRNCVGNELRKCTSTSAVFFVDWIFSLMLAALPCYKYTN